MQHNSSHHGCVTQSIRKHSKRRWIKSALLYLAHLFYSLGLELGLARLASVLRIWSTIDTLCSCVCAFIFNVVRCPHHMIRQICTLWTKRRHIQSIESDFQTLKHFQFLRPFTADLDCTQAFACCIRCNYTHLLYGADYPRGRMGVSSRDAVATTCRL